MAKSIRVYDYTDYREFLADYYAYQKEVNPIFSYRYFAQKANISSSGFYKEVVDGKRGLSRQQTLSFSKAMKFSKKEAEYFENMVYFDKATSTEEQRHYFKKLISCYDSKAYKLLSDQYEYFSKWYYVAIRELLSYIDFVDDYKALASELHPPIRPDQAKKAIAILKRLGLIQLDANGYYRRCDVVVSTKDGGNHSLAKRINIINFQKELMNLASTAYDRSPLKEIDMATLTLSMSEESYLEIKEELSLFRQKLLAIVAKDNNPDRIYHLNHQFFPLSKLNKRTQ